MMNTKIALVFLLALLPFSAVFALEEEVKFNDLIDVMATGGAGVAGYTRFGDAWMNPASKAASDFSEISILQIGAGVGFGFSPLDLFLFTNFFKNGSFSVNSNNLTGSVIQKLIAADPEFSLDGPLCLGWYGKQFSLLLSDELNFGAEPQLSAGLPYVNIGAYFDTTLKGGYAFEIPIPLFLGKFNKVYAGIDVKLIDRFKFDYSRLSLLEAADIGSGLATGENGILNGVGFGSDIGFMMKDEQLAFGLVIRDWFTTPFFWTEYVYTNSGIKATTNQQETTYYLPSMDFGASYHIKNIVNRMLLSDLMLYADVNDIFNFTQNYFLRLRLGAEVTCFTFLKVRIGLMSGYPTCGLGIDIPGLKINATYYTEELGIYPGAQAEQHLQANLQIAI